MITSAPQQDVFISTWTGLSINLMNPQSELILMEDISRGLAHQYRFGGHTSQAYTVAQHSIFVSELVAPEYALQALLHDATEAYIGDLPSPVKSLCPDYKQIEARLHAAIMKRFKLPMTLADEVRRADRVALATEKRDLMPWATNQRWRILEGIDPVPQRLDAAWSPEEAFQRFSAHLFYLQATCRTRGEIQ